MSLNKEWQQPQDQFSVKSKQIAKIWVKTTPISTNLKHCNCFPKISDQNEKNLFSSILFKIMQN